MAETNKLKLLVDYSIISIKQQLYHYFITLKIYIGKHNLCVDI